MARTKYIPGPKPPHLARPNRSQATPKPAARTAATKLAAPNGKHDSQTPQQAALPERLPTTAKATAWIAVIKLGASNGQAVMKKPGGEWELVRWAQGVSASSIGGAGAIPACLTYPSHFVLTTTEAVWAQVQRAMEKNRK